MKSHDMWLLGKTCHFEYVCVDLPGSSRSHKHLVCCLCFKKMQLFYILPARNEQKTKTNNMCNF